MELGERRGHHITVMTRVFEIFEGSRHDGELQCRPTLCQLKVAPISTLTGKGVTLSD